MNEQKMKRSFVGGGGFAVLVPDDGSDEHDEGDCDGCAKRPEAPQTPPATTTEPPTS